MEKKIKVLTLSDHPLSPSGVGTQTRYILEALLKTGKFQIVSLGGAIKHQNYSPTKVEPFGDDWVIIPVDGYGNQEMIRSLLHSEKPDIVYFMTDPRFWGWLWDIENEIRAVAPMVYYHVWDNFPAPKFNKVWYESNDFVATISKVTDDIVKAVAPNVAREYIPHSVDTNVFKKISGHEVEQFKREFITQTNIGNAENRKYFFWNNRNARRKQSGTLIYWFKEFLDVVGNDNATLIMHTDPKDPNGQDLEHIIHDLGITNGEVIFSTQKYPSETLAIMYNMCDVTLNISDAEGFGLSTLESLACEVPIVVNMTGGLQEQVTDGKKFFGVGIEPTSKAVIGSQDIPYIYEDRISKDDFIKALVSMHKKTPAQLAKLGKAGRAHVLKNYNYNDFNNRWIDLMLNVHETCGSWETRKNYQAWGCTAV